MSWSKIDTNWELDKEWRPNTIKFLDSLHPITANIVLDSESRVPNSDQLIVKMIIQKVDEHIRKMCEKIDKAHAKFNIGNYPPELLAEIIQYAKRCIRSIAQNQNVDDPLRELDYIQCAEMSYGNLSDYLNRIESSLDRKFVPLCKTEAVRSELKAVLGLLEDAKNPSRVMKEQEAPETIDGYVIPDPDALFENEMSMVPPKELEHIETIMQIQCPDKSTAQRLSHKLFRLSKHDIIVSGDDKEVITVSPKILGEEQQLSINMIRNALKTSQKVLKEEGYRHMVSEHDDNGWLTAKWSKF